MQTGLYFIEIDDDKAFSEYDQFLKLLSMQKQEKIKRFKYDIDKKLSLFSDLFIRLLVC